MFKTLLLTAVLLMGCDGLAGWPPPVPQPTPIVGVIKTKPPPTCEQIVCSYMAQCHRVQTGGVDFTNYPNCIDQFECIGDEDQCLNALADLPCWEYPPSYEELVTDAHRMTAFRAACMGY